MARDGVLRGMRRREGTTTIKTTTIKTTTIKTKTKTTIDDVPRRHRCPFSSRRHNLPERRSARARPASSLLVIALTLLLLLLLSASPASAARVPVASCLSSAPSQLQWRPLFADARFSGADNNYRLELVVWGNVSGSLDQAASLPPAGDSHWTRPQETEGKIADSADKPDVESRKATTLIRKVNVLTYEVWADEPVSFCKKGLVNGTCPLGPVFDDGALTSPRGLLPSVNLSHDFFSPYSFASFAPTIRIIYGDAKATDVGCITAVVTPDLASVAWLPRFLPLVILLISGLAVVLAAVFSPWGSTSIVHWSSNYGRDADLLRLVTPGFGDCLQYIQFVVLTGALSLSYPGYYQPVVAQAAWSALMFNQSVVTGALSWQSVVDGIYVTNSSDGHGLQQLGQLAGMARSADVWPGFMVCLGVILVGLFVAIQTGFLARWLWRRLYHIPEEDLRAKNVPFTVGNLVRTVFNYMLVPIVALSCFQLVVARSSPAFTVALAVLTLVLLLVSAAWMLALVIRTRPKSVLFDDLPTLLRIGPLYNTYSDQVAAFALIPVVLNLMRGIAIGAVQPSGVAQVVLLAICEVIQVFTLHAFRPFPAPTSMNAYHTVFSLLRAVTLLLMVAFVPSLGVAEGRKCWIGYAILLIHAAVLVLGFFLSALKTMVEVLARLLGAGGDDVVGLRRGGLSKIFGMRQLSRRETHRPGISRASHMSTAAILEMEDGSRAAAGSRMRSASTASLSQHLSHNQNLHHRQRSSSALDSIDLYAGGGSRNADHSVSGVSYAPGETAFSFLASPRQAVSPTAAVEAADPYYRPPRRRRDTLSAGEAAYTDAPRAGEVEPKRPIQGPGPGSGPGLSGEVGLELPEEVARGATTTQLPLNVVTMDFPPNRPDYSTREVDFYYGVRGPALNSVGPGRKLGTGPADPTGPVATATGWFRNMFKGKKTKEKGKGFEVVRSSRMPPASFGDETPPEGIPVAMGVLRNGPIDSDDDSLDGRKPRRRRPDHLLTDAGDAQSSDTSGPNSPVEEGAGGDGDDGTGRLISPLEDDVVDDDEDGDGDEKEDEGFDLPVIPRKSSKRNSGSMDRSRHPILTLPAIDSSDTETQHQQQQRHQQPRLCPLSLQPPQAPCPPHPSPPTRSADRPASFGVVRQHGISRVDPGEAVDLMGRRAEVIDGGEEF
ncbi:integral membrane protein [Ophiocordyceps camponoti-floridani]|uniref:Integral membrane protein n=1 Tax=Ophiocordyceps camponoti-floridani TaxID=2030778 RepID=A0A8H4VC87_9HYPO|nr:integral membrane protein [Ophiocordyceps camponoti-floridani]